MNPLQAANLSSRNQRCFADTKEGTAEPVSSLYDCSELPHAVVSRISVAVSSGMGMGNLENATR